MGNQNVVSARVADFLKNDLGFSETTLYTYDCGLLKISCDPLIKSPIPAPEILRAVDFLKKFNIYVYYFPEDDGKFRGVVKIGIVRYQMKTPMDSIYDVYKRCLEFICNYFKK